MCGIAGIINKTPRDFDFSTFCTLGISNDARGGDSCGVFIDGRYGYGVGNNKFFTNYFQENELIYGTKKSTVALVHCRKASVGIISEKTAQPVIIKNENGGVDFVVMHNGTIYNYENLASKYIPKVNITGMTDSQVMAHIFYYAGYDVLNEYNGSAVFVIVDYRKGSPKTLLFKGASKKTKTAKEAEAERPLYYCIDKVKRELVFSSTWPYLIALRKDLNVYELGTNKLMEFAGSSLNIIAKYGREGMQQDKEYKYDNNTYFGSSYNVSYDNYIQIDLINNLYKYRNKRINGKLSISNYGRVDSDSKDSCDIWFFEGVALKNKDCYDFLDNLRRETKLSSKSFFYKFENVIRYLSVDGFYPIGDFWYEAVSPCNAVLFTGIYEPLTSVSSVRYLEGLQMGTSYKGNGTNLAKRLSDSNKTINFKEIREECECLMK